MSRPGMRPDSKASRVLRVYRGMTYFVHREPAEQRRAWRIVRRVPECGSIPRGYGVAWHDFQRRHAIVAPIPLNVLIAWTRALWLALKYPRAVRFANKIDAYAAGLTNGRKQVAP